MYALGRSDVEDLNRRARTLLRAAGVLTGPDVTVAGRETAVGDTVLTLRNDQHLRVRNGTVATLVALTRDHAELHTPDGLVVLPAEYLAGGQLTHAYPTTIHKAQGATVDHAFLLGSDRLFREAGYVGLSRARRQTRLCLVEPAPDPAGIRRADPTRELTAALSVSRAQTLAADQLPHPGRPATDGRSAVPAGPAVRERPTAPGGSAGQDRRALLADPPTWVISTLGAPPLFAADRRRWADSAQRIAAYRHDHLPRRRPGLRPFARTRLTGRARRTGRAAAPGGRSRHGPEPTDPARRRARTLARLAIVRTRDRTLDRQLHRERTR